MVAMMLIPTNSAAEDVVLIGNSSIKQSTLNKKDVIRIFQGKTIAWSDKNRIVIVFQKDPIVHNAFLKKYIHQNPSIFVNLWKRKIFTGKVAFPEYVQNDREMIGYVSRTRGAIGYASAGRDLDAVKTFRVR